MTPRGITATYGVPNVSLAEARRAVEQTLGSALAEHESLYLGGVYYRLETEDAQVLVRLNRDLLDNTPEEEVDDVVLLQLHDASPDGSVKRRIESSLPTLRKIRER